MRNRSRNNSSLLRPRSAQVIAFTVLLAALSMVFSRAAAQGETAEPGVGAHPIVLPSELKLTGHFAHGQLLVQRPAASAPASTAASPATPAAAPAAAAPAAAATLHLERSVGLNHEARFTSLDPLIATVSEQGLVLARRNGETKITIEIADRRLEVPVQVTGCDGPLAVQFTRDIRPILNKSGCAMAACHAAQHGKGGFKLSVFGSEPVADHRTMVRDSIQRRIDLIRPEESLLLLKPTMAVPHGGGRKIERDSVDYEIFAHWLRGGAPGPQANDAEVVRLAVTPPLIRGSTNGRQQLRVEAEYADGMRRDVTAWARFDSLDDGVVAVTRNGLTTMVGQGQAPIMVRFEGQAAIALFVVPYADTPALATWQNHNFVDELAAAKFRELGIEPSRLCDDATFVRRAYLDAIGTLPTATETLAFSRSTDPNKRFQLVDRLLGLTGDPTQDIYNDAYSAYWSLRWSDLIRNSSRELGEQGMWSLHNWVREAFRENRPFDQFVRELVTAKGSIYSSGPANFFRVNKSPTELTEAISQTFLGIRLECAKCHHHPFEKYSEDDYYQLSSFFARVGSKNSEEFGLFGRETVVMVKDAGEVSNPRSGKRMAPKALDGPALDHPLDRRIPLAAWLTAKDNPYFARNIANRYVDFLLGRGLVEPVDDMRATNPPTNPALLEALAKHFAEHQFNLKQLMRVIMHSRLYQLDSRPTPTNARDQRFYSHFTVKRMAAEPLADAIDRVTGVQTKYKSLPLGTRAIELPDAEYPDYFLNTFAKPRRASVCECERSPDANLAQALHTLNGDTLPTKIADKSGRIARLLAEKKSHEEVVTELYLWSLSRMPTAAEIATSIEFLDESPTREECYHDLLWALLNSKQFLFVH